MRIDNNAANRLHRLLTQAKQLPGNTLMGEAWRKVLRLETDDLSLLLLRLGRLLELPHRVQAELQRVDAFNPGLHLRWKPAVDKAFSGLNLGAAIEPFQRLVDQTSLYSLEVCGDLLARFAPERVLEREEISELWDKAQELLQSLDSSDLPVELDAYLRKHATSIIEALSSYDVVGVSGVQNAVESAVGSIPFNASVLARIREQDKPVFRKFWTLLARAALIVSLTTDMVQLGQSVVALLPEPAVTAVEIDELPAAEPPDTNPA